MEILVLVVQILARKMKKTKTDYTGSRFAKRRIETTKKKQLSSQLLEGHRQKKKTNTSRFACLEIRRQ
jgi:hypothetical protein